ncbi:gliding motility-associated C-terminal domain-containing protein [Flavivirga abyssicola]|uniref:T9SS type B sorting domain-containing protein n=1 Tax=Flavivirga abyssicola TaxID=3063533 RepID=UPI0026DFB639|nr:gliding motility-associated C-terminal domain-containing protein [Flavivirga sp. MEBiC07777]WVK11781.1 gliding motility-associated C-terminal domain-containing protein [Flavivirga sp. MEBiC07777]
MLKKILFFVIITSSITKSQAQCTDVRTIDICDMTIVDSDPSNPEPDGIINLYDRYNALPGVTPIDPSMGNWVDPNFNFALDGAGNLHLWDLDKSSEVETDHQFHFLSVTSGCPNNILIRLNVVVGAFSGYAKGAGTTGANVQICDLNSTPRNRCNLKVDIDLFNTLEPIPSPHLNGTWVYNGGGSGFVSLNGSDLTVTIPYDAGPSRVDEQTFQFTYIVQGMDPCNMVPYPSDARTNVSVSVVRKVFSGYSKNQRICEDVIKSGRYDVDIDLRNDEFLELEDIDGTWTGSGFGQVTSPIDSRINIKDIYDQIIARDGVKFGCAQVNYDYTVKQRSGVCADTTSTVSFKIYEALRPFSQSGTLPSYCEDDPNQPTTINLYNELEFTTENGISFEYNRDAWTNWRLVSGPSNLGLVSNGNLPFPQAGYSSLGPVSLLNAPPGNYVFEYVVYPEYNCWPDSFQVLDYSSGYCDIIPNNTLPCQEQRARVRFRIHPKLYAGEDTGGLLFCETDPTIAAPLDLFTLLTTNGVDDVYQGPQGRWVDLNTGNSITNPFTIPQINNQQTFNFEYITRTVNNCEDRARLSFTVFEEYQSGVGLSRRDVCDNNVPFDLFDDLTGNPNTNGTWTGPNGYTSASHNAIFTPGVSDEGDYIYIVPNNVDVFTGTVMCNGNSATITVVNHQSPSAGTGGSYFVCRSDLQIDLVDYLDASADSGGVFRNLDTTDLLTGSLLDVSQLGAGTYNFQYEIQGHVSCNLSTSQISITVVEVPSPNATDQIFCASIGATVLDLVATSGVDFNWYDNIDDTTPLSIGMVLINGEDYFVAAVDSEGCESSRIGIVVELLPLNHPDCISCFKDGISVNGDGENDAFDLCGLPTVFPDFELNIYNRFGTLVYKGNRDTPLFEGKSNVSLTVGDELPSGVYFYVFDPKDGVTDPIQGNFYLSR